MAENRDAGGAAGEGAKGAAAALPALPGNPLTQVELAQLVLEEGQKPKEEQDPRVRRLVATVNMAQLLVANEMHRADQALAKVEPLAKQAALYEALLVVIVQGRGGVLRVEGERLSGLSGLEKLTVKPAKDGSHTLHVTDDGPKIILAADFKPMVKR